jgi:hypothetical protein
MTSRALCIAISSVCLASVVMVILAQEPVIAFTAGYQGGSLPLAHEAVAVRITSDKVSFVQGRKQLEVPVSQITFVAYSDPSDVSYVAGMQWDGPSGQIVLSIQRQDYWKAVTAIQSTFEKASRERAAKNPTS